MVIRALRYRQLALATLTLATSSFPWSCLPLLRVAFLGHVDSTYNVISYGSDQSVLQLVQLSLSLWTRTFATKVVIDVSMSTRLFGA